MAIKGKKAFTLIEMIIVIAIIGVLVAILIPTMTGFMEKARETTLQANSRGVETFLKASTLRFDVDHLFANSDDSGTGDPEDQTYLSRYLETYFEQSGYGKNNFAIENPFSGKTGVLNYSSYKLGGDYRQLAMVISNNADLKYSGTLSAANGKTYLMGSVIVYMKNGDPVIQIYYIDKDGHKSDTVYSYSVE
jgi:prepilin-type N-terminal cleavage/methylation domain-containing protein